MSKYDTIQTQTINLARGQLAKSSAAVRLSPLAVRSSTVALVPTTLAGRNTLALCSNSTGRTCEPTSNMLCSNSCQVRNDTLLPAGELTPPNNFTTSTPITPNPPTSHTTGTSPAILNHFTKSAKSTKKSNKSNMQKVQKATFIYSWKTALQL